MIWLLVSLSFSVHIEAADSGKSMMNCGKKMAMTLTLHGFGVLGDEVT
jgi:hypothetical protein